MKHTVFIIHGFGGSSQSGWRPWLQHQLEDKGYTVRNLQMPNADEPVLSEWLEFFEQHHDELTGSILVGHSLGASFILRFLERADISVDAAYLVAGPIQKVGIAQIDPHIHGFLDASFDWGAIQNHCEHIEVFHSDNDEYVPLWHAEKIRDELQAKLYLIPGGGHLNEDAGYKEFLLLLERITVNAQ
jgi:uncharacterized protein